VDSEIIEGQLKDFLLRFGGKYDGNGMWGVSLYLEDICQIMSALSRQAPAAPAAKDFEQWWTSEVVANGGAPIGADYKHWAKAGFELRGDARAPAAPAEADFEREVEDWEASQPFYDLAWRHGASQHLSFDGDELESLTFSVKDFENFCVALTPAAPTQALLGWTRYEKARKLNPAQWAELHQRNLRGENFDDMIDALPAATQPAQQDTRYGTEQYLRGFNDAKAQFATPPAEKQAAPSGEALLLMMRAQAERMPDMTQIEALRLIDMALQDAKGTKS
jgi:hypothetical protein